MQLLASLFALLLLSPNKDCKTIAKVDLPDPYEPVQVIAPCPLRIAKRVSSMTLSAVALLMKDFNTSGLFKDMFQSHYLSILYLLIGDKINNIIGSKITKNLRGQYKGYGGCKDIVLGDYDDYGSFEGTTYYRLGTF